MPGTPARSATQLPHITTVAPAVLRMIVHIAGTETEGVYKLELEAVEPIQVVESEQSAQAAAPDQPQALDHRAEIVLRIKLTAFYSHPIGPIVNELRARIIERVHQLTDLRVQAVHVHVGALQPG